MTHRQPPRTAFNLQQVTVLYGLAKLACSGPDLEASLAAIASAAYELTGAAVSAILLLDDSDNLVLRAGCGSGADALAEHAATLTDLGRRALGEGNTLVVPDTREDPGSGRLSIDARSNLRSYVCTPLISYGMALGVAVVAATTPHGLGAADVALIEDLAELGTAAVVYARAGSREHAQRVESQAVIHQLAQRSEQVEILKLQLLQTEKLAVAGHLTDGIVHDLNTPLGVIMSNLSVLQEYGVDIANFARAAQESVLRLQRDEAPARVAESLRVAAQSANLDYVVEDLPQLAADSIASARRIATIVHGVVTSTHPSDELAPVTIEQALYE